jgi:hypothetical protein
MYAGPQNDESPFCFLSLLVLCLNLPVMRYELPIVGLNGGGGGVQDGKAHLILKW